MTRFYSPKFLMAMKDRNGNRPEIFVTMGNRTSGKTFGIVNEILIEEYINKGRKVGILTRIKDDLGMVADGIFKPVLDLKYPDTIVEEISRGKYSDIYFVKGTGENKERTHVGYVLPINRAQSNIKPISGLFSDCDILFRDEFQTDSYVPNEIEQFKSLHTSVARGGGKAVRYVPVIMASNFLDVLNPYFSAWKIVNQLQPDTRKFRGNGIVLEIFINDDVQKEQEQSGFNQAFGGTDRDSNIDNMWLLGNNSCICKPEEDWGMSYYLCTVKDENNTYGVRHYPRTGLYYINYSIDSQCTSIYNMSINGDLNLPLLKSSHHMKMLKEAFKNGQVRCKDVTCKQMMLTMFV